MLGWVVAKRTNRLHQIFKTSFINSEEIPKMALTKPEIACENVLKNLKISRLTFTVQETPFSAYVTIRKKFIPNAPAETLSSSLGDLQTVNMLKTLEILNKENSTLKSKLKDAENQSDELIENNESLKELSHQSEFDKIELVN